MRVQLVKFIMLKNFMANTVLIGHWIALRKTLRTQFYRFNQFHEL